MDEKKNRMITLWAFVAAVVLLLVFMVRLEIHVGQEKEQKNELSSSVASLEEKLESINLQLNSLPEAKEEKPKLYTVREHEGKIGIFDGDGALIKTINAPIEFLPKADRELLERGIDIYSDSELYSLIEDYS